jgi:predicted TIM-barrel fold metal-dependent hydrolase
VNPLGIKAFDADNHYYEALDAFTRHLDPAMRKRGMQWAEIDGKAALLVGGKVNRFIPNPTFDPVSKPGALDQYFRGHQAAGRLRDMFGELDPISPAYRDRDARLAVMDAQDVEGAFYFPTLGVGMEQALIHDPEALVAAFHAFNLWLDEDWGFHHHERIFAAPMIPLVDPDAAVRELEHVLGRDARVVLLGIGPILTPSGGVSPGDPVYDPFWARVNEAGITVVYHGGDSAYTRYMADWGESTEFESFRTTPLRRLLSPEPVQDTLAALLAYGVLTRFPNLRVAAIETGSQWVPHLFQRLKKSWAQTPHAYAEDPRDTFRRQVWVSPFYEDDLRGLAELIGVDHMLMGSDWPHAEGLAEPITYQRDLEAAGFTPDECRLVMRENGLGLSRPRLRVAA